MSARKHTQKRRKVWVGFSDGKPHRFQCSVDGDQLAVFPTRKAAREKYQDVRAAYLVMADMPKPTTGASNG